MSARGPRACAHVNSNIDVGFELLALIVEAADANDVSSLTVIFQCAIEVLNGDSLINQVSMQWSCACPELSSVN